MSHLIEEKKDGTFSFVAARKPGWHGLGRTYTDRSGLDLETVLSDLDVGEIITAPVYTHTGNFRALQMPGVKATVRRRLDGIDPVTAEPVYHDTPLGVVGDDYGVVDERTAFSFLQDVADTGLAEFETAMLLKGGTRAAAVMRLDGFTVGGVDAIDMFMFVATSHDGSMSLSANVGPVRVVCQNTLTWGLRAATQRWSIRHSKHVNEILNAEEAKRSLKLAYTYGAAWAAEAEALLKVEMTKLEFEKIVAGLYAPTSDTPAKSIQTVWEKVRETHLGLWNAPTQGNVAGTAWAGLNALTEYHDWYRRTRSKPEDVADDTYHFERALTEGASPQKNKIYDTVRAFAGV